MSSMYRSSAIMLPVFHKYSNQSSLGSSLTLFALAGLPFFAGLWMPSKNLLVVAAVELVVVVIVVVVLGQLSRIETLLPSRFGALALVLVSSSLFSDSINTVLHSEKETPGVREKHELISFLFVSGGELESRRDGSCGTFFFFRPVLLFFLLFLPVLVLVSLLVAALLVLLLHINGFCCSGLQSPLSGLESEGLIVVPIRTVAAVSSSSCWSRILS
jgi:hypothetical protein